MTETGLSLGTPHYMSPEQATAEKEITARSDVYSLASVLYEMLTGEPPTSGGSAQQIIMKIIAEPVQPVTHSGSACRQRRGRGGKALEKLPADRFESAKALLRRWRIRRSRWVLMRWAWGNDPGRHDLAAHLRDDNGGLCAYRRRAGHWGWTQATPTPDGLEVDILLSTTRFDGIANSSSGSIEHRAAIAPDGSAIVFTDSTADATELHIKWRGEHGSVALEGTTGGHAPIYHPRGSGSHLHGRRPDPEDARGWWWIHGHRARRQPGRVRVRLARRRHDCVRGRLGWIESCRIVRWTRTRQAYRNGRGARRTHHRHVVALLGSRGVLVTSCGGNCESRSTAEVFDLHADTLIVCVPEAIGAWYVPSGQLLFTSVAGGLYAVGFDANALRKTFGARP